MSETARALRRQIEGRFPNGNPLTILGISAQVLNLGLTEDELYDYIVKDVARRLVMRFHPDHASESERPGMKFLQHRYSEAYKKIQDHQTFDEALAEFRNLKAEERREMTLLSKALTDAREEVHRIRQLEPQITEGVAKLEQDRIRFDLEEKLRADVVPSLNRDVERLHKQNGRLRSWAVNWGHRTKAMNAYVSLLMGDPPTLDRGPHAFEAKWVAVASLVPREEARKIPRAFTDLGNLTREFRRACEALGISKGQISSMRERWLGHLEEISKPGPDEYRVTYKPRLTLVELSVGKPKLVFGYNRILVGGRVIGALSPDKTTVGRRELTANVHRDTLFARLAPNLTVGGLMVHGKLGKAIQYPSGERHISDSLDTKFIIIGAR